MYIHYSLVKSTTHLISGDYITYGICATCKSAGGKTKYTVYDITTNRKNLIQLIKLCNKEQLHICHLADVIEDFLYKNNGEVFSPTP